jgi:membrane protein
MLSLARLTLRRARQERLPQVAASLSFTTLLSLVPFVAVSFALFTRFPALFGRFEAALEAHLMRGLLPAEIARTVIGHLDRFALNAGGLTGAGTAVLLLAALAMLWTVERVFNDLWGVRRPRPWLRRLGLYGLVLLLAPPLLGFGLWALSAVLGASLGWIGPLPVPVRFVLDLGPPVLAAVGLSCLYRFVPNARVPWLHALVGGLLGSAALELGKRGFTAYVLQLPTYKTVYGSFAVFPLLLLWIYFSWLVILGAALVAANLGRSGP